MTGFELLKYLTEVPREALEQEVLFEVQVGTTPEIIVSGHVPIIEAHVADSDRLLYPDCGLITPEQAMNLFSEVKQEIAAGEFECTEEKLQDYNPFFCPKIISDKQLVMKLQGLKAYKDPEPEPENEKLEHRPAMRIAWGKTGEA